MFKKIFKKVDRMHLILALCLIFLIGIAAAPSGVSRITSLFVGAASDSPGNVSITPDNYMAYIKGDTEIDGVLYADGGVSDVTGGVTATEIADVVRYIQLPLGGFVSEVSPSVLADLTTTTVPGWEIDDYVPALVWADGEVTPAVVSFKIPSDWISGGTFKIWCSESESTTPQQVDFEIWVNRDDAAFDAAAVAETPVALATTGGNTATNEVVLLDSTTFDSLVAADDWITLKIWRDNASPPNGTGDLEVKGVAFYYTASQ